MNYWNHLHLVQIFDFKIRKTLLIEPEVKTFEF